MNLTYLHIILPMLVTMLLLIEMTKSTKYPVNRFCTTDWLFIVSLSIFYPLGLILLYGWVTDKSK